VALERNRGNWTDGYYGGGLKFDGSNDFVDLGDKAEFEGMKAITIETWAKFDSLPSNGAIDWHNNFSIVDKFWDGTDRAFTVSAYYNTDKFAFNVSTDTANNNDGQAYSDNNVVVNHWYHIAAVWDSEDDTTRLYVDGVPQTSTGSKAGNNVRTNSSPLSIGRDWYNNSPTNYFDGIIDDVRIYSRAKSADEIYADYNAQKHKYHAHIDPSDANLVGLWHLDGMAESGAAMDSSMQGNHGELEDVELWDITSGWAEGKYGNALEVDGLNDRIQVPYNTGLNYIGGEFSLEAWIKPDSEETTGGKILSKPWNGSGQYNYWLSYGSDQTISVHLAGTTSYDLTTIQSFSRDAWHHVVATVSSDSSVKLYVDGALGNNGTHSIIGWAPSSGNGKHVLCIGTLYCYAPGWAGNTGHAFDGLIDEVAIYNRALTATEVKDHYYAFVNKGMIYSPGAIKAFEGS